MTDRLKGRAGLASVWTLLWAVAAAALATALVGLWVVSSNRVVRAEAANAAAAGFSTRSM